MSDPSQFPTCNVLSDAEFAEISTGIDRQVTPVGPTGATPIQLNIEVPVTLDVDAELVVSVLHGAGTGDFTLFAGKASPRMTLDVQFPNRPDQGWPNGGYLRVSLLHPTTKAICNWGLEELIRLDDQNAPRAFRVELLREPIDADDGGRRLTRIAPL